MSFRLAVGLAAKERLSVVSGDEVIIMSQGLVCPAEFKPAPSTMASFVDNSQFPWMAVALREYGVTEQSGTSHNPRVVEYLQSAASWVNDDETAWCSGFVNWVMSEIGIEGTGRLNARSWQTWGTTVPNASPHYGAIAVLWRVAQNSPLGHVGFFCGMEAGRLILLGGNQTGGTRVSLSSYPRERLLTLRWPPHFPPPNMSVPV